VLVEKRPEAGTEPHEFAAYTGSIEQEALEQVGVSRHSCG
jgi:hypothetical protein